MVEGLKARYRKGEVVGESTKCRAKAGALKERI